MQANVHISRTRGTRLSIFGPIFMQSGKGSVSNFTWKMPLSSVEQFTLPTEVKGVLEGWEKKRILKRALLPPEPTEKKGTESDSNKEEKPQSKSTQAPSLPPVTKLSKPPKPRHRTPPRKAKPMGTPKIVRARSRPFAVEWTRSAPALPKTAVELPPPQPVSRKKRAETHLFTSINEYDVRTVKGENQQEALNRTMEHAQSIIRNFETKLFDTEQMLSQATIAKDRELEEKMNRLFASISTKANGRVRGESGAGHVQGRSREAVSNPSL